MPKTLIFDQPHATRYVEARQATLQKFLPDLKEALSLRTAVDVGCGAGYFSTFLCEMGFQVVALDARQENIEEAARRHPGIEFHTVDLEDSAIQKLGRFDLVFCFGLLYHLENPLRAFRHLFALTNQLLLLESMAIPGERPILYLHDEPPLEDQSLHSVGCCPTEACLVKMAYHVGFPYVYRLTRLPDHEEFQATWGRKRRRTMLAAAKAPLTHPLLALAQKPVHLDPWSNAGEKLLRPVYLFSRFLRKPWSAKLEALRRHLGRAES